MIESETVPYSKAIGYGLLFPHSEAAGLIPAAFRFGIKGGSHPRRLPFWRISRFHNMIAIYVIQIIERKPVDDIIVTFRQADVG